jgi:GNAT superfamily N-acetyltransferase
MVNVVDATATPVLLEEARKLFREYQQSLPNDRDFQGYLAIQGFEAELASLPWKYVPPQGRLLIARVEKEGGEEVSAGCVALLPLDADRCEMKRMYVRPDHRGESIGRVLALAIVDHARAIGYRRMLLDTLPHMKEAIALYRSIGFKDTARYRYNPVEESLFFELIL